jgi:lipoprotein-anchoring transpeptidase ErfK/SrfK
VPILEKASSRRSRVGDFFAILILLGAIIGGVWLWQQERAKEKAPQKIRKPAAKAVAKPAAAIPISKPPPVAVASKPVEPVSSVAPAPARPPSPSPVSAADFPRPARDVFEAQVALARRAISPGSLDGVAGSQTRSAIAAFQRVRNLFPSGTLDTNTRPVLALDAPLLADYIVSTNDLARLQPLGKTWLAKSQQTALDYETILELVAEKAHSFPSLIQRFNPGVDWTNVPPGTVLKIPAVEYPEPAEQAAFVVIHLSEKFLEAFGSESNLLLHCPCSIAAKVEKRPVGELHVSVIAPNPNYTFDPAVFPESAEAQALGRKLILQPGPNNPVGVAWIGLDKPGYGMHGTPGPEQVGRTESHGCFRLANWDAAYLLKLAWVGLPVQVVP